MTPGPSSPSSEDTRGGGSARSVLIVEDDGDIRETLAEILEYAGYSVETVANGREAIARLEHVAYDAIVSDLRMPVMTGVELFRWLQRDRVALVARFVLITGDNLDIMEDAFLAENLVPVLAKPFAPADVRRIVAAVTGGPTATAEP